MLGHGPWQVQEGGSFGLWWQCWGGAGDGGSLWKREEAAPPWQPPGSPLAALSPPPIHAWMSRLHGAWALGSALSTQGKLPLREFRLAEASSGFVSTLDPQALHAFILLAQSPEQVSALGHYCYQLAPGQLVSHKEISLPFQTWFCSDPGWDAQLRRVLWDRHGIKSWQPKITFPPSLFSPPTFQANINEGRGKEGRGVRRLSETAVPVKLSGWAAASALVAESWSI